LIAISVGVFAVNAIVASVWSSARHSDRATRASQCSRLCRQSGNMGLPMARLAFGEAGLAIAVVMFVTGVVLWSSAGIALGAWARGTHRGARVALAPLRYPSIYAAALGAIVNIANIDLSTLIRESTTTLADASIPCMLVVLGLQFRRPRFDDLAEPLATSVNRLLIGPLAAWPLAVLVGLEGIPARTSIMMAGMPTAVMTTISRPNSMRALSSRYATSW
jgi:predicted permease